jgi:hypothetical protein
MRAGVKPNARSQQMSRRMRVCSGESDGMQRGDGGGGAGREVGERCR